MTNKPSRIKTNQKESDNSVVVLNDPAQISFPTKYDTKELQSFLDFVFHGIKPEDTESQVLLWKCKTHIPGYPSEEESVLRQLDRTNKPLALYYGTSSCVVDTDGKLYNKKALFKQLHVVVLDDIGTKIPEASLPKGLEPSYIVESSEGNFQYGFVLETPIDVLEHATALIHLVYGSGYSDTGGGMPTKAVRLPGGVNGKTGTPKQNFLVNLRKTNGPRWTPEKLLEVLEIDVTWDYVKENTKVILNRNVGTSAWSPIAAQAASMTGVIDPVLEWLYDNNLVKSENDEWVTFECPWSHNHSSGDEAGYSPLGRGKGVQAEYRGYHCFHDACNGTDQKTIYDLLQHVAANGGPEAAVHDPAAKLVSEWAYDSSSDSVWQVRASHQPRSISMQAFKHTYPNKLRVVNAEGKIKKTKIDSSLLGRTRNQMYSNGKCNNLNLVGLKIITTDFLFGVAYSKNGVTKFKALDGGDETLFRIDNNSLNQEGKKILYVKDYEEIKYKLLPYNIKNDLGTLVQGPLGKGANVSNKYHSDKWVILEDLWSELFKNEQNKLNFAD